MMWRRSSSLVRSFFWAMVVFGCSEGRLIEPPGGPLPQGCDYPEDCPVGHVCLDGACLSQPGSTPGSGDGTRCQVDADCDFPDLCLHGVCRPPGAEAPPPQGGGEGEEGLEPKPERDPFPDDEPIADPAPDPPPGPAPDPPPGPDPDPEDPGDPAPDPEPQPCDDDRFEPNDDPDDATPVGGAVDEGGLTVCEGDVDLFSLDLAQGAAFSASVRGPAGMRVELLEADGATIVARSRAMAEGARTGLAAAPEGGLHFVRVTSAAASADYSLEIMAAEAPDPVGGGGDPAAPPPIDGRCEDDLFEPNDGFASAVPLGAGVVPLLRVCDGNPDLFAVDIRAGQSLRVSIAFNPEEADLDLALHAPDTTLVDLSDGLLFVEEVGGVALVDGWFFIAVYPFEFVGSAGYLLTIEIGD